MTLGWIFEGDRDRFLSALDPTTPPGPALPSFQCPFCKECFPDREQLSSHVELVHVVNRPFVLIAGAEPGAEGVIRPRVATPSVETFNCTELAAGFDGESIRPIRAAALARRLARVRRGTLRLRLTNLGDGLVQSVVQEYRLKVLAPDETDLADADGLFLKRLGAGGVNLENVGLFYETTRDSIATEYAEALADYVRGVLLKDGDMQTGVSTHLHHYHDVHNRALNVLRAFDRPLAKLLCALMRFGLNDFSRWSEVTGFARLDHAYSLLGALAEYNGKPANEMAQPASVSTQVFVCPVDIDTDTVTRLARQATELPRWGSAAEEQFSALAERPSLDSFDRAKIRALWAVAALRLNADMSARRALMLLDGDPTFGAWASRNLQRIES